jgi:small GTP-binding protein
MVNKNVSESNKQYGYKVILLGDETVGKTSLFYKFINNKFEEDYRQTLGTEILLKEVNFNDMTIMLQIWDVAGGKYFSKYRRKFYNGASGALIIFDLTNKKTFHNIVTWRKEFENNNNNNPSYVLVGNKKDLVKENEIEKSKMEDYTKDIFLELTSAKTGENVEKTFKKLAEMLYKKETGKDLRNQG